MSGALAFTAEDVRVVTGDVWESCLARYGDSLEWGTGEPPRGEVAQALIRIVGEWSGVITLEMSSEAARTAARLMLQSEDVEPTEVADAVGELVNIIGGNVKSLLPARSRLSLPQVTTHEAVVEDVADDAALTEQCRVDLSWGRQPILVRVWS